MGRVGHHSPLNFFGGDIPAVASRECRKSTSRGEQHPTLPNDSFQGRQRRVLGLGRDACPSPLVSSLLAACGCGGGSCGIAGRAQLADPAGAAAVAGGRWAAASGDGNSGDPGTGFEQQAGSKEAPKARGTEAGQAEASQAKPTLTAPAKSSSAAARPGINARTHSELRLQPGSRPASSRPRTSSRRASPQRRLDGVRAALRSECRAPLLAACTFSATARGASRHLSTEKVELGGVPDTRCPLRAAIVPRRFGGTT